MKSLLRFFLGALASLGLLAAAGFFHQAIQRDEAMTAQRMRAVESIRATQGLASQWSVEVGKVRDEVNGDFDVLADFIGRMEPHVRIIQDSLGGLPDLPPDVKAALHGYVQRLKAREERIERFKSGFAIARNSRRFIPWEGEALADAARDGGYGKVEAATRQLLKEVRDFPREPSDVHRERMEQAMHTLAESAGGTPLRTRADTLNKHVGALLKHSGPTEQRFQDIMRADLEDRAEQVIGLLDADHRESRTKRRYFDYGFWLVLAFTLFYWGALLLRWMSRRRQGRAAAEAPKAAIAEGPSPVWGMEAALATAGATAGGGGLDGAREDRQTPPRAGTEDRPAQDRGMRIPEHSPRTTEAPGGRGTSFTLEEERPGARDEIRWAVLREHEDAGTTKDTLTTERAVPPARRGDAAGDTGPTLEERLEALKAELGAQRAQRMGSGPGGPHGGGGAPTAKQGAPVGKGGGAVSTDGGPARTGGELPEATAGSMGQARRQDHRDHGAAFTEDAAATAGEDGGTGGRASAIAGSMRQARRQGHRDHGAAFTEDAAATAGEDGGTGGRASAMEERLKTPKAEAGAARPMLWRGPAHDDVRGPDGAAATARQGAPAPTPDKAQRRGGDGITAHAGEPEGTPAEAQSDGSGFIHRAIWEAVLDRLGEVEQEIRAATDAAEQAERAVGSDDGEGGRDAWTAAAGRMAGARWAVRTLLKEVDRLPATGAPREALPPPVDMRALLERHLSTLVREDRKRIDATLAPGAVTRGNRQALETAMRLIVQYALEGARLHPRGEGYVTLTLAAEDDGVHLTCLDHGPGSEGAGERRNLALAVARGLVEGQGGEMETVPYLRHGTMIRLRF